MPIATAFKCLHDCGRSFASEKACKDHERDCTQLDFLKCGKCQKKGVWSTKKAFRKHTTWCGQTEKCKNCPKVIWLGHNRKNMIQHEKLCKRKKEACKACLNTFFVGDKEAHLKKCRKNPDRVKPLRTPRRKARTKLAVYKEAQAKGYGGNNTTAVIRPLEDLHEVTVESSP